MARGKRTVLRGCGMILFLSADSHGRLKAAWRRSVDSPCHMSVATYRTQPVIDQVAHHFGDMLGLGADAIRSAISSVLP